VSAGSEHSLIDDAWDDLVNAEIYAEFTETWSVYHFLNQTLADAVFAEKPAWANLRILDLACGSGATTQALLRHLGPQGEIHCVDRAAAMVAVARELIEDPRVTFEVCAAEELHHRKHTDFDTVVCNAAFWHFQGNPLAQVAKRLRPNGSLYFTVPANYVRGLPVEGHPLQAAITRVLTESHSDLPAGVRDIDPDALDAEATSIGFEPGQWTPLVYESTQAEFVALLKIPAMSEWIAPGLNRQQRDALINQASRHLDPNEPVTVNWFVVRFRRVSDAD